MAGKKLLDSSVEVDEIIYERDITRPETTFDGMMNSLGRFAPVLKINNIIIPWAEILHLSIKVEIGSLPTISLKIDDSAFRIREALKDDLDIGTIRIGYKNWAIKFNAIFTNVSGGLYKYNIYLNGYIFNQDWYNTIPQKSYKQSSIQDIIYDITKDVKSGLYVYSNELLSNKSYDHIILSNYNYLEAIDLLLKNYTNNFYAFDANYFLHIGDFNTIKNEPIAEYTLDWKSGESIDPKPMEYSNTPANFVKLETGEDYQDNDIIPMSDYNIDNEFSSKFISLHNNYKLFTDQSEISIIQNNEIGIGEDSTNTFSKFVNHIIPYQNYIRDKELTKNLITFETNFVIPELNPFDVIKLKIISPESGLKPEVKDKIDEIHSGNKIVIGYEIKFKYDQYGEKEPRVRTVIKCI